MKTFSVLNACYTRSCSSSSNLLLFVCATCTLVDIVAGKQANIKLLTRELLHIVLILVENYRSRLLVVGGTSI